MFSNCKVTLSTLFWEGKGDLLSTRNDSILFVGSQTHTGEKCTTLQSDSLAMLSKWVANVIGCKSSRECYPMRIKLRMLSDANPVASFWDSTNNGYQLKPEDKQRGEIYLIYSDANELRRKFI